MVQKRFGSLDATGRKLDVISEYLGMYQRALNGKFDTVYVDAFAGTGEIPLTDDKIQPRLLDNDLETKEVLVGSAVRAITVDPPFKEYHFIDKSRKCVDALRARLSEYPNFSRANFKTGDANDAVQAICQTGSWRYRRGVVLLDPFGSQVDWATVEAIAETRALDLWYLFPAGVSVFRQISSDGTIDRTHKPSIDRIFGTADWETAFLKPSPQGHLFDECSGFEKVVTAESAAQFMIDRMKSVFQGGVMEEMIPLGRHAYPSYYLLFAWGNNTPAANRLARKLSSAAIKATDRKHGRIVGD